MEKPNVTKQGNIDKVITKTDGTAIGPCEFATLRYSCPVCGKGQSGQGGDSVCVRRFLTRLSSIWQSQHSAILDGARCQKIINLFARALKRKRIFRKDIVHIIFPPRRNEGKMLNEGQRGLILISQKMESWETVKECNYQSVISHGCLQALLSIDTTSHSHIGVSTRTLHGGGASQGQGKIFS